MKNLNINIVRVYPIITIAALLQFCAPKASKTVVSNGYEEDLSVHRSLYETKTTVAESQPIDTIEARQKINILPMRHIADELDSVNRIIISQSQGIKYIDGYTIQLYSGNDRNKANEVKRKAYELIEGITPRVSYEQPNYKVKIGNYYNRLEANADFTLMKNNFSRAVLIPARIRIDLE